MRTDNKKYNEKVQPNTAFLNELKNKLPQFFSKNGEFDLSKFQSELDQHNVSELKDGYQLNFIGKDYARRQTGEMPSTVIVPDQEQNNGEGKNSQNLFFTGDNLEVLRHLQANYANKIDVIYIDPPYNTGNDDFVYPDTFEYSDDKLREMFGMDDIQVKRLKSIQGRSSHSSWLTFMYPRLYLAKKLLADSGCLMVSIDENEDMNLKEILNEIFGENNFVGQIIRKTRSTTNDTVNGFNQQHEFLYIYAKNIDLFKMVGDPKEFDSYSNPDDDPNGDWKITDPSARSGSNRTNFEIINPYTGKVDLPPKGRYWAFSKNTMNQWISDGKFVFKKNYGENERGFFIKKYVKELKSKNKQVDSLFGTDNIYMNQSATKYLRDEIFNGVNMFSSPKPVEFISKIMKYTTKKDSLVLDFFAGSATTAESILRLNAEDGGHRKFIMVQLPEKTYTINNGKREPIKNGKAAYNAGFKSIDEIARERIRRVSAKMAETISNLPKDFDGSFKHYRVVEPTKQLLDDIEEFDPNNTSLFTNMVDSFSSQGLNVTGNTTGEQTILTTWMVKDGYPFNADVKKVDFNGYKALLIEKRRLYIINEGWSTRNTEALLNKIGTHQLDVQTIVLFGYSFKITDLRELEIGLKQIDSNINLLKRY